MTSVRDKLIEDYAVHYTRMQHGKIDPRGMLPGRRPIYELESGDLVRAQPRPAKILDLGCGTGNCLAWLAEIPGVQPYGVDGSSSQIEIAKHYLPDLNIELGDGLEYLKAHPNTFNGIICTDVFEHIPGKDLLAEWVRSCKEALVPGGFLFCRMPNATSLIGSFCRYRDLTHECSFTVSSMLQLLEAAGLQDCKIRRVRSPSALGKIRLWLERRLHRIVYVLAGELGPEEFTSNICGVGYRK